MLLKKLLVVAAVGAAFATPAQAVDFQIYDYGAFTGNEAARKSFQVAADYWSSVLTDDVTVNILVANGNLSGGSSGYSQSTYAWNTLLATEWVYEALAADSKTALDQQAVANLQPLTANAYAGLYGTLTVTTNGLNAAGNGYVDETTRVDNDNSANNATVIVNTATARAMNVEAVTGSIVDDTYADGVLYFSNSVTYDYDPTDGITAGSYDYTGIAIRSIAVTLGLDSYLSVWDNYTSPGGSTSTASLEGQIASKTIDLFRYSGSDTLDWSTSSSAKYFSIDGGDSQLFGNSEYRTGRQNGDGAETTFWKDSATGNAIGIMDADPGTGTNMSVSALDLAAADAIGWDLNFDVLANSGYSMSTADIYRAMTAVPEPSTWLQMILGFGMIGGVARHWRHAPRRAA